MVDHSLTYTDGRLRNWGHRARLAAILDAIDNLKLPPGCSYLDCGCSNGFLTERVAARVRAGAVVGLDHSAANLAQARRSYPSFQFAEADLNHPLPDVIVRADLVTCFETLEHVGRPDTAIASLIGRIAPGGHGLISVPIERGMIGLAKFAAKMALGYSGAEIALPLGAYARDLVLNRRIDGYRPAGRDGFGTHFGFDDRMIGEQLSLSGLPWTSWTAATTRLFLVQRPAERAA